MAQAKRNYDAAFPNAPDSVIADTQIRATQTHKVRLFCPSKLYGNIVDLESIECPRDDFTRVACHHIKDCEEMNARPTHNKAIVVTVDGKYFAKGVEPIATVGVYFGRNSPYNLGVSVRNSDVLGQTEQVQNGFKAYQRVQYIAAQLGLREVLNLLANGVFESLNQIILKTASVSLVRRMMERTAGPVENEDDDEELFKALQQTIEKLGEKNVEVLLWHVPSESTIPATILAESVCLKVLNHWANGVEVPHAWVLWGPIIEGE
ncbi:hypothetical protein B0J14DRAFT_360797 [Halenospora varia]|nr:hypothetical protein B0J14DRAFT_360797 [Halenospora varia]